MPAGGDLGGGLTAGSVATHEHTINVALGEVLQQLRPHSWRVVSEEQGQLRGGGRPDILIEEASQWPVVIEAASASIRRPRIHHSLDTFVLHGLHFRHDSRHE